jgi:hypothetical protein
MLHYCEGNGYIGGHFSDVPEEFYQGKERIIIGCNRLWCHRCNGMVETGTEYTCGCGVFEGGETRSTDYEDDMTSRSPWSCAGHPLARLPHAIDGKRIATSEDAALLMRQALAGRIPKAARPGEKHEAIAWPAKLYIRFLDTGVEHAISRAAARCLTDSSARTRGAALWFFQRFPEAAGAERIESVLVARRTLFRGVPDPTTKGKYTLDDRLLGALGARILAVDARRRIKNRRALALARAEMLRAGPQPLMSCMSTTDHRWLAAHAVDITRASPDGWYWLMISLPTVHFDQVIPRLARMRGADLERLRRFVRSTTTEPQTTRLLGRLAEIER